jgi:hypothetical protein
MDPWVDWLDFNEDNGVLHGTPQQKDVGEIILNISVNDGNKGLNWTRFTLKILDINEPPQITTAPITSIVQDRPYYVDFMAIDRDGETEYLWFMMTDASWLSIDAGTGEVSGTPCWSDVGTYFVNVSVMDRGGDTDWINYTIEVLDSNDIPIWANRPEDTKIDQGEIYEYDAEATDNDPGDVIEYGIKSTPVSAITINRNSGLIKWTGSLEGLTPSPYYVLNVEISATDGIETIYHAFTIRVIPNPSPISTILDPRDGKRVTSRGVLLEWEAEDDGEEPLKFDIYLCQSRADVLNRKSCALLMENFDGTSIHSGELEKGMTYYWTVIPKDCYGCGSCCSDVYCLMVNTPPTLDEFTVPLAREGEEFVLTLYGRDLDGDDIEFSIIDPPRGLDILNGIIIWTPLGNQTGTQTLNISLSDGYDTVYREVQVNVRETELVQSDDDKGGSSLAWVIIVIAVVVILMAGAAGLLLLLRRKQTSEEDNEPPEINEEDTEEQRSEMGQENDRVFVDPYEAYK